MSSPTDPNRLLYKTPHDKSIKQWQQQQYFGGESWKAPQHRVFSRFWGRPGATTSDITNHSFLFCSCLLMLVAHVKWSTCSAKFKGKPYPNPSFPQLLSLEPFSMFLLTVLLFWQAALMLWFTLIHHIMFIHLTSQYICNTVQGVEVRLQACKNTSVL